MKENLAILAIRQEQLDKYIAGIDEGYEADPNQLPAWYWTLPPVNQSPSQRGYVFGRELKVQELLEAKEGA
jgi:hypothetical protein